MYKIFKDIKYEILKDGKNFEIKGIEFDSRKIEQNFIFVAMKGSLTDGHNYINKAIKNGARMVIVEDKNISLNYDEYDDVIFIFVENIRKKLGIIASNYYDYPQNKLKVIGITGTNGKTTCSYILENILDKTARIGTIGNRILDCEMDTTNTTPESLDIIKLMDESVKKGVKYFIMEVSSHALEIGRVDMLKFDAIIFTNLTQDHMDFHGNMENYFNAKKKIFSMLKENSNGIVNADDLYGKLILEEYKDKCKSIGIKDNTSDITGEILEYTNNEMKILVKSLNLQNKNDKNFERTTLNVNLMGEYNLYNILSCIGIGIFFGVDINEIFYRIENIKSIPGRFEVIKNNNKARIVVDFAHTDDGLLNVGTTLRNITENRIITLFGAGGDRDTEKRPKMAEAAAKFSDFIILTSDNPRTENPMDILQDIKKGLKKIKFPLEKYVIIENREEAIKYGVEKLREGDSFLIAGKGHENYQIIGKEKKYFDDREIVKKIINKKEE